MAYEAGRVMASEKAHRRRSRSAVRRAWLYCLFMALPTFLFAGILVFRAQITLAPAILIACCLLLYTRRARCV